MVACFLTWPDCGFMTSDDSPVEGGTFHGSLKKTIETGYLPARWGTRIARHKQRYEEEAK